MGRAGVCGRDHACVRVAARAVSSSPPLSLSLALSREAVDDLLHSAAGQVEEYISGVLFKNIDLPQGWKQQLDTSASAKADVERVGATWTWTRC